MFVGRTRVVKHLTVATKVSMEVLEVMKLVGLEFV